MAIDLTCKRIYHKMVAIAGAKQLQGVPVPLVI